MACGLFVSLKKDMRLDILHDECKSREMVDS